MPGEQRGPGGIPLEEEFKLAASFANEGGMQWAFPGRKLDVTNQHHVNEALTFYGCIPFLPPSRTRATHISAAAERWPSELARAPRIA